MFRLQNNVPEVYPEKSRDFQLFCRLYDVCFNGTKYSIDSMSHISNTKECDSRVLELLKSKLGLFSTASASTTELRYLLQAFPIIMRYKGCKQGVNYIKILYTKMYNNVSVPNVEYLSDYKLLITFAEQPRNDKLLLELLKYVLPTGYLISYQIAKENTYRTIITTNDKLIYSSNDTVSKLESNQTEKDAAIENDLGAIVGISDVELTHADVIEEPTKSTD